MAAICTHYLFAERMMGILPTLMPHVEINEDAVFWGTQGPDIFFFHRALPTMPGKSCRKIGSQLHRFMPSAIFEAIAEYLEVYDADKSVLPSYAAGFIMHYALDRNIHPYVFYLQEKIAKDNNIKYSSSNIHNAIEKNIDVAMLIEMCGIKGNRFDPSKTLRKNEAVIDAASGMLSYIVGKNLNINLTSSQISQAFYDTAKVQSMLFDLSGKKYAVSSFIEKLLPFMPPYLTSLIRTPEPDKKFDYMNSEKLSWYQLDDSRKTYNDSVFEIFERALSDASSLIGTFFSDEAIDYCELTGEITFDAGEPAKA